MNEKIFRAYDIRGKYPDEINADSALEISRSIPKLLGSGKIVIAHDVRRGAKELTKAIKKGLAEGSGKTKRKIEIISVGLSTTPMFYFLVNHYKAKGGMMVTASHNPKEYNGIKIVGKKAVPISGYEIKKLVFKNKS